MSLAPGRQLGNYEIVSPLGVGGMGEVYRARDPRLNREVAIKVLPDEFAADPERLARFQREAQMLAALNHSNIAAIYGLEEAAGTRFLVLELVPGETLAELLAARGPVPVREVLDVARQLAEALEAAHEKGIIHRDLKPANIKLTPECRVKVLDFGLAKAFATDATGSEMANSPTLSMAATRAGVLLGTAAYMSPEQTRGKLLDRRTDVWAFGCVLYELLTAAQAFAGDTVSDAVAVILTRDPDWAKLPPSTPQRLRELLRRCLQKDPGHRLRDMGDARIEIEEMLAENASGIRPAAPSPDAPLRHHFWQRPIALWQAAVACGLLMIAAVLVWVSFSAAPPVLAPLTRTSLALPRKEIFSAHLQNAVAISPDGRRIAFVSSEAGVSQLYVRQLEQSNATVIPESQGAANPIFSPDGNWIAFVSGGKLRKVSVQAGGAMTLCNIVAGDMRGASWGDDGWIYMAPAFTGGISRIPEGGGKIEVVTTLDEKTGERTHRWPFILPGGKALLYTIGSMKAPDYYFDAQIAVRSLATGQTKILVSGGTDARYVSSGHLLYSTASGLVAAPFALASLEIQGPPIPLPEQVAGRMDTGAMHYAISHDGIMIYVEGEPPSAPRSLNWVDLSGKIEILAAPPRNYYEPALSPDGKRVAVTISGPRNDDIWIYDIPRNSLTRFTYGTGAAGSPLWTPDGSRIVYTMEKDGKPGLFWKLADGSGEEERLVTTSAYPTPCSFTGDGKTLVYVNVDPIRQNDIYAVSLEGDRTPRVVLSTEFNEEMCSVSPDGKWLAYVSNETGREELYVRGFAGAGGKWQISVPIYGAEPQWSASGRELFYRAGDGVGKVDVAPGATFMASGPKTIIPMTFGGYRPEVRAMFSVAPDGKRVLAVQAGERDQGTDRLHLVLGWSDQLKRLAATNRK